MKVSSLRNLPPRIVKRFWQIKNYMDKREKMIFDFEDMRHEVERSWKN